MCLGRTSQHLRPYSCLLSFFFFRSNSRYVQDDESQYEECRGLQAVGIDSAQYGALLLPMEKSPEEFRFIVSREHKENSELTSVTLKWRAVKGVV